MQVKKAIRYGVMVLLTAGLNQACEAQSKEETLQWIKSRLPYVARGGHNPDWSYGYSDVVVNGCSLTFTETHKSIDDPYDSNTPFAHDVTRKSVITVVTVPLGHLSSVNYVAEEAGYGVTLKTYGKLVTEKWTETSVNSKPGSPVLSKNASESDSEFEIAGSDSDLARRLVKAFSHANELCGGGKEAF